MKYGVEYRIEKAEPATFIFQGHVNNLTQAVCFFITKKGYFRLGYPKFDVEDQVFILAGGRRAFILRKTKSLG